MFCVYQAEGKGGRIVDAVPGHGDTKALRLWPLHGLGLVRWKRVGFNPDPLRLALAVTSVVADDGVDDVSFGAKSARSLRREALLKPGDTKSEAKES
jgi:hypothetical protein